MFVVLFIVSFFSFFNEAMISDTKHFFFCQSTHFQVLHYAQNKYLKKDLYKAQNAYNASRYGAKSWGGGGELRGSGSREEGRVKG